MFRGLSQEFNFNVNPVSGRWHCAGAGYVADILEILTVSLFKAYSSLQYGSLTVMGFLLLAASDVGMWAVLLTFQRYLLFPFSIRNDSTIVCAGTYGTRSEVNGNRFI
jgi:hypothetical protein